MTVINLTTFEKSDIDEVVSAFKAIGWDNGASNSKKRNEAARFFCFFH